MLCSSNVLEQISQLNNVLARNSFFFLELANLVQTTVFAFIIPLMETESNFSIIFKFSQELMKNPVFVVMRVGDESIEHKALLPQFPAPSLYEPEPSASSTCE